MPEKTAVLPLPEPEPFSELYGILNNFGRTKNKSPNQKPNKLGITQDRPLQPQTSNQFRVGCEPSRKIIQRLQTQCFPRFTDSFPVLFYNSSRGRSYYKKP